MPETCSTPTALLDAAETLFGQRGYAAVGLREIVDRAGANLAAVAYHFGGKSELYLATVRRALERRETTAAWALLEPPPRGRREAATTLARFIHQFLARLLSGEGSHTVCRFILQEATDPTQAMPFVIRDFMQPHQHLLTTLLETLLPKAETRELAMHVQSILGQLLHYHTYQPFLESMELLDTNPDAVRAVALHIARFSLRGLGCSPRTVEIALDEALGASLASTPNPDPQGSAA